MRSFGSTRSPRPSGSIRLWLVFAGEDHPRACTGRRLVSHGFARAIRSAEEMRSRAIVLDPHSPVPLSGADRPVARKGGVIAIDCSWNRLAGRGDLPPASVGPDGKGHRRLPFLLATNPQHFGRLAELNTAEALGAALYVLGATEQARRLLEGFAGGEAFFEINRERLDRYADAALPAAIVEAEGALFGPPAEGSPR